MRMMSDDEKAAVADVLEAWRQLQAARDNYTTTYTALRHLSPVEIGDQLQLATAAVMEAQGVLIEALEHLAGVWPGAD